MQRHFESAYGVAPSPPSVGLGNIAEGVTSGVGTGTVARDMLLFTIVNTREERTLKNLPTYVRNDASLRVTYENQPFFLNLTTIVTATHTSYTNALLVLSRALRFFQSNHVFTHESVAPSSITTNAPPNSLDQLESFKLIFDLYSPTMEEVNHMWGTLGGKQYPFAMFNMRLVDLKFRSIQAESGVITEITHDVVQKNGGGM
jgi:hypothetical protein